MSESNRGDSTKKPGNGHRTDPGAPPPLTPGGVPSGEADPIAHMEEALDDIRAEIRELHRALGPAAELGEVPQRISDLERKLSGIERDQKKADEQADRRQKGLDEIAQKIAAGSDERGRILKVAEAIGAEVRAKIPEVLERESDLADRLRKMGEELVNYGQLLTLLKGMVEKNSAAFKELQSQGEKLLASLRENDRRFRQDAERSRAEEARRENQRGVALFYRGAFDASVEHFRRAAELQEAFPEALNNLGLAYSKMGRAEEASEAFRRAIELEPKMAEAYNNLGFLYHSKLEYPKAIEMFRKALLQNGDIAAAYTNLGNSFYMLKQHDRAVTAWKRALEIDPLHESAKRSLKMFDQAGGEAAPGTAGKHGREGRKPKPADGS